MTTLLEHLTGLSDAGLRLLFRHRPDLGIPGVADFSGLATRASTQISVLRALERLNEPQLQVLTAAVVHPAGSASVTELSALLAQESHEHQEQVAATVAELVERALLLPATRATGSERWAVPGPVRRALGPYPGELGRPAAALGVNEPVRSAAEIDRRIAEHPEVEPDDVDRFQRAVDVLAHSPVVRVPDPPGQVLTVLLDTGILVPTEPPGTAELPRETGLAARGGTLHRSFSTTPPSTGVTAVLPMLVANAAAASISDLLRTMTALVRVVSVGRGVPTLRTGGVGVREVQQLARRLDTDVEEATWLLEAAAAADVIALNPDTSRWETRYTTVTWSRLPRHRQWQLLTAGWLTSQRAPWTAPLTTPAQHRPASAPSPATPATATTPGRALAPDRARADAPRLRQGLLEAAGLLDARHPNTTVVDGLETFRRWQAPRAAARTQAFTAPLAAEATRLGLFGAQGLTAVGRALAATGTAGPADTDDEDASGLQAAASAVAELLPAPIRTLRLQADLTAVAPGFLDPELTARLERFADDEGDGTAAVFRFSADSIRRGLDAGLSAEAMLDLLTDHSGDPVPQTLRYLIDDTARRHLALAVHRGGAVLTAEDPATLTTLLALPELAPAGLHRLSDTVALSRLDDGDLHALLAETGHRAARPAPAPHPKLPVPSPESSSPAASSFPVSSAVTVTTQRLTDDDLDAQIRQLRATPHRPTPSSSGPEELIAGLAEAAHQRRELTVTTADRHGAHLTRRLLPTAVSDGRLRGRDLLRDTDVVVPLHRVVSAEPTAAPTIVSPPVPVEENP